MRYFVKAVITGFGLSVGKMLYDKVSERWFGEKKADDKSNDDPEPVIPDEDDDDPVVADPE